MKVERQKAKPAFNPIVITLETEEEAEHLWHKLNNEGDWQKYCEDEDIPIGVRHCDSILWHALSEVFDPTDDC